jgi:methylase of polypeptide subunit release factors
MNAAAMIFWEESGQTQSALWRSENAAKAPQRVVVTDDTLTADSAYRLACEGTAILWRGDFQNARQLLQAMRRRLDKKTAVKSDAVSPQAFHLYRQSQLQRARIMGMLLIPLDAQYRIPLRRAPDVSLACMEAYGPTTQDSMLSLRELLGVIGAHEWRKSGVEIPVLGARIHPHYGVFSPVRGEYLQLLAEAPLPDMETAFDIGTGTGVIAALLARRGIGRVIATDTNPAALACARENIQRLGLAVQIEILDADLFPPGKAGLIVCNPPWLPASANSVLDHAIYDPDSRMLKGFLAGLAEHLETGGEGWLILSDLAEHLGLRTREELLAWIAAAGLQVTARTDIRPTHPKTREQADPLHAARQAEITSLWCLRAGD